MPNSDQTNFPVLIYGTYPFLAAVPHGQVQNPNVYDIIFTSDSAGMNVLDYEVEAYNPSTGQIAFWVTLPLVSHTSDTVFYVFYGNPSVSQSQQNQAGAWANNYKAVWHMGDATTQAALADSSGGGFNLTKVTSSSPSQAGGEIAFGQAYTPPDANTKSSSMILNPSAGDFTFSAWFSPVQGITTIASQQGGTGTGRVWLGIGADGYLSSNIGSSTALTAGTAAAFGSWSYGVVTLAGNTLTLYLNGQSVGTATRTAESATGIFDLGADQYGLFKFDGSLDEVRISSTARSADWISAEYANQVSPNTFYSLGQEIALDAIVTVAPVSATLYQGLTEQFTATVQNAGNTSVNWSINPAVGTVSGAGLYTPPAAVGSAQTVYVTAQSQEAPTASATAAVSLLPVSISVAPTAPAPLYASQTQQFTATVNNAVNQGVTWTFSPAVGTLSSSGLYTAPSSVTTQQTVTVTATSQADSTKSASAPITLYPPVSVTVSPTAPQPLYATQTQLFTATVRNASNQAVAWTFSPAVGTLSSSGLYTAPSSISSQQTVTVTATSQANGAAFASVPITLYPPVAISMTPGSATLGGGEELQLIAIVTNAVNTAVTWSISPSVGTISTLGLYTPPSVVASNQTVTVTAQSQANTAKTAAATISLVPVAVSISPGSATLWRRPTSAVHGNCHEHDQ